MIEYLNAIMPIVTTLLGFVCMGLGWLASQMWSRLKANEDKLAAHQLTVAENYVRHDRMQEIIKPLATSMADVQIMVGRLLEREGK